MEHTQEPVVDDQGNETHPAYATISASRVSHSNSKALYGSDVTHRDTIRVYVETSMVYRDLGREWRHPAGRELVAVEMSAAQWADFVSSVGNGPGAPCTLIRHAGTDEEIPEIPYAPRIARNLDEVEGATEKTLEMVAAATTALGAAVERGAGKRELRELVKDLDRAVGGAPNRAKFAVDAMARAAEAVVVAATADIEARAAHHAATTGDYQAALGAKAPEVLDVVALPDSEAH